jgi:RNA polymerase sigma-70 factor (ECF subfamily)
MEQLRDPGDPAAQALLAERGEAVREAVAALPEPYREVITLRFFGDLTPAAIAAAMGRPEGTVRAQLHRGLARLRGRLQEDWR